MLYFRLQTSIPDDGIHNCSGQLQILHHGFVVHILGVDGIQIQQQHIVPAQRQFLIRNTVLQLAG